MSHIPNPIDVARARMAHLDKVIPNATGYDRTLLMAERERCASMMAHHGTLQASNREMARTRGRGWK